MLERQRAGVQLPLIAQIVAASTEHAAGIVTACLLLAFLALAYTTQHFAMTTDTLELTSPDLPWRRDKAAFDGAFPQQSDLIVVVVDGTTPELAERAAARLTVRLSQRDDLFRSVRRPDAGPFLQHDGLLLLPIADVATTTKQLIAAQAFLAPLAADQSLRGVMESLSIALEGVRQGAADLSELGRPLAALADTLAQVIDGKPAFFSWRVLMSGQPASLRETRRIVLARPKLDNGRLMPGTDASEAIREIAQDLECDPAHGIRVRLTGSVVLADQEFATLIERAGIIGATGLTAMLLMLWLAVRSVRIVACILMTTVVGLIVTTGLGLGVVGRFNVISVAFIPLFVSLGIDFSIQFSVRCRAERLTHRDLSRALTAAGSSIGGSLALAASALALGFFAFLPTAYRGASELGLVAGIGMVIAFLLSVTFLPALLTVARPGAQAEAIGFAAAAPLDRYLANRRKSVLAFGVIGAVIALALLPLVRFDFNPLHLRSEQAESVSTFEDLLSDPDRTPNSIDVLAPSPTAADDLARRVAQLPEVDHVVTLRSFVPDDQPQKLGLVRDAAALLDLVTDPIDVRRPPTDEETARSLARTAADLQRTASGMTTEAANQARRLSAILERLVAGPEATLRSIASDTLITPLAVLLDQIRAMLRPQPVTLESLPPELVEDWVSRDGRARIQVFPKGDSNDNRVLRRFSTAVQAIAPEATGPPILIQKAARTIVGAFVQAGIWSFLAISALLWLVIRRGLPVVLTLVPVVLTGLLTLGSSVLVGPPLDFADIIALPLLVGVGVAFNIYFVVAWQASERILLESSLARGILFSALTTGTAFGSLWLSSHPGTASMGKLLMMSLAWTLVTTLLFQPALLASLRPGTSGPRASR
jgi:uncharacterized protein